MSVVPIRPARRVSHGLIHVLLNGDGLEVLHESASGGSFGSLGLFAADQREVAVQAALNALPQYAPCKLGEVSSWE